ncbi:hypothetical protein BCR33DRAFT_767796 [Rhizoclosmatium globosum]|uniref:Ribophorin II C-terminal domain-containing protein n=1 Tax=Rhizoclosmatium globosum TaxID=329046 RepID=A0A1Y2C227_9FUNG|nr:hypothetical protein BCR33DRAFT_767796 [Rhizoclosmatium globosum]|eukprot:ORY41061.1 hypothetical protein BCR33DRAFT_767796 [Rhizoclosmatium globosum]
MSKILALLTLLLSALVASAALTTKAIVIGRDGGQVSSVSVKSPKTLAKPVIVGEDELLALGVVSDEENDVVFAHFAHTELKDVEASFPFEAKGGKHELQLDFIKKNTFIYAQIKQHPGLYTVTLLSRATKESVKLGQVKFEFRATGPSYHVLGSTETFEPVNEIYHQFRQPEKMPPAIVSYAFAAAVVGAPWALLIILWSALKVNVSNISASGASLFWGPAFLLSLTASCVFFYVYWVQLNLFQLFGYGSVIWSVMGLLGRQALVARANVRLKEAKKGN